jgi:hypothetical protein
MNDPKAKTLALMATVDVDELTIRLLEISCEMKRPLGRSTASLMAEQRRIAQGNPLAGDTLRQHENMAQAAVAFMVESINAGQRPA